MWSTILRDGISLGESFRTLATVWASFPFDMNLNLFAILHRLMELNIKFCKCSVPSYVLSERFSWTTSMIWTWTISMIWTWTTSMIFVCLIESLDTPSERVPFRGTSPPMYIVWNWNISKFWIQNWDAPSNHGVWNPIRPLTGISVLIQSLFHLMRYYLRQWSQPLETKMPSIWVAMIPNITLIPKNILNLLRWINRNILKEQN